MRENNFLIMKILENYLKIKMVQKGLNNKTCEKGFSLIELIIVIAVLAILSAIAIPAFVGVQKKAKSSSVKNGLVNGVKECSAREAANLSYIFTDVRAFAITDLYPGYTVTQLIGMEDLVSPSSSIRDSCYAATFEADEEGLSDFSIYLNRATGVVTKRCSDHTSFGCNGDSSPGSW
tara:strand:- start:90 stop:620 length:531 start_codon:yes stop_codon:yes gene_type:complete